MDCKFVVVDIYGESGIEELGSELRKGFPQFRKTFLVMKSISSNVGIKLGLK
jgi:hypothetical protein